MRNIKTPLVLQQVRDMIVEAVPLSRITQAISAQHGMSPRSVERYVAEVRKALATEVRGNAEKVRGLLWYRLERQYLDSWAIEDIDKRLRRQREIVETQSRITGADQPAGRAVNVFNFFPTDIDKRGTITIEPIAVANSMDAVQPEGMVQDG